MNLIPAYKEFLTYEKLIHNFKAVLFGNSSSTDEAKKKPKKKKQRENVLKDVRGLG